MQFNLTRSLNLNFILLFFLLNILHNSIDSDSDGETPKTYWFANPHIIQTIIQTGNTIRIKLIYVQCLMPKCTEHTDIKSFYFSF